MAAYVEKHFRLAIREISAPSDGQAIESEISGLDRKIGKVLDAIENVYVSDSLAGRLRYWKRRSRAP